MYKKQSPTPRGKVTKFSAKSKSRLTWVYNQYDWKAMLTLTYHKKYPENGRDSKYHLRQVTDQFTLMGIKYLWVLEWQGRGFPHYHIWLSRELIDQERIQICKKWLKATKLYNDTIESENFHLSENVYTKWEMIMGANYAVKYAYKSEQKGLPLNVSTYGRWYGTSRMKIEPDIEYVYNSDDNESSEEMKRYQRNVHRCIYHWSKNKKKHKRKKNTTSRGFFYILTDNRRQALTKLFEYHFGYLTDQKLPEWVTNHIKT